MRTFLILILVTSAGCIGELDGSKSAPPAPPIATDPGGMPPAADPGSLPPGSTPIPPVVDPTTPTSTTTPPAGLPPAATPPATAVPPATTPPATRPPVSPPAAPGATCAAQRPIPADAEAVLQARCQTCHASRPIAGVQGSLTSTDDFMRPSKLDPNRTVGQLAVARISD